MNKELGFKCDFCGAPPTTLVDCESFDVADKLPVPMTSLNEFMCCDECYDCVQRNDRDGLLTRSREGFKKTHGFWDQVCEAIIRSFHQQFWQNKK